MNGPATVGLIVGVGAGVSVGATVGVKVRVGVWVGTLVWVGVGRSGRLDKEGWLIRTGQPEDQSGRAQDQNDSRYPNDDGRPFGRLLSFPVGLNHILGIIFFAHNFSFSCQFDGQTAILVILPDFFTLGEFVREQVHF